MNFYQSIDHIHHPSVYELSANDSLWTEVDTFQMDFSKTEAPTTTKKLPTVPQLERWRPPRLQNQDRIALKNKIAKSHAQIRKDVEATGSTIIPRTQAHNRKCAATTLEEERAQRASITAEQIKTWRSLLPSLLKRFSQIKEPRRVKSIEHQLTTLVVFGLFAFIFRLQSRREMNRELTGPVIFAHLKKIFPDLETIPHADTLARLLEKISPLDIEKAHVELIKDLIKKKKFKKLLIDKKLPIGIDGTQKLFRDGLLNDGHWCERDVGKDGKQQYVYVIEANISLKNGLTIPLMTEYLYRDNNKLTNPKGKEDCELAAFERLAERLKKHFPRLKMVLLMDSLYATQQVMRTCFDKHWDFLISLPGFPGRISRSGRFLIYFIN
jgi:hypothetical protein